MKKAILLILLTTIASTTMAKVYFSDSFGRPQSDDLDAVATGMDGLLVSNATLGAGSTWIEAVDTDTGNDHKSWIRSNNGGELVLAEGSGTSHTVLDHNFIDSGIQNDGMLKLSLDLININSANTADRYLGYGVGMTASESTIADSQHIRTAADFFAGMNNAGAVIVYTNAVQVLNQDFGADNVLNGGTLSTTLDIADFNAGSAVGYEVFLNHPTLTASTNQLVTSGSFIWNNDNSNYIGIGARASTRTVGDNFLIETETSASASLSATPSELSGTGTVSLAWSTLNMPAGSTYGITADRSVAFPDGNGTGSADGGNGTVTAHINDDAGDTIFTLTIYDNASQPLASNTTTVAQAIPAATLAATPSTITGSTTIALNWTASHFPNGSTYSVTANQSVAYPSGGQTGSLDTGSGSIDVTLDDTTEFTMVCFDNLAQPLLTNTTTVTKKPNVVVILFDDTGWSDLGCYGSEIQTPVMDGLAANGLRYRNFYQAARCSPSRCAILTGLYTQQVAAIDPSKPLPNLLETNNITIAELLGSNGYRTYMAGKWHIGSGDRKPLSRGFDHAFGKGTDAAGANVSGRFDYWKESLYYITSSNNEIPERTYTSQFHHSDAVGDYSVDFINHNLNKGDGKPFFIYMAFNAPHWPVNAPAELANKYTDVGDPNPEDVDICRYEDGWDVLRETKYQRQLDMGVIDERFTLSPKGDHPSPKEPIVDWDTISASRKKDLARRQALYAAMVEQVDANIGKVVDRLDEIGQLDNTFIIIVSDNGSNYEGGLFGSGEWAEAYLPAMGQPQSVFTALGVPDTTTYKNRVNLGGGWANFGNMPFRLFKHFTHNGGIRTPAIAHWPAGMDEEVKGTWSDEIGHLIDVMATVSDITGATYPSSFNGHPVLPIEGSSLRPTFEGTPMPVRDVAVEHENNRAFFRGKWKFVTKNFAFTDGTSPAHQLELYDMEQDPTELNNLASVETEKLEELVDDWNAWVTRVYDGRGSPPLLGSVTVDYFPAPAPSSKDLFFDTFARPDNANADASYVGMSGKYFAQLGANSSYYQAFGSSRINTAQLRMQTADNGLMHNFVGQDIIDAGGFSVGVNIAEMNAATSAGFGIGLSQAEASAATAGLKAAADCFVELDSTGTLSLFQNGTLLDSTTVGSPTGSVVAAFETSAFTASGTVDVTVYFNGRPVLSGNSVTWDASNQNHIGLAATASGYVNLDNLAIRLLPIGDSLARVYALQSGLSGYDTDSGRDIEGDNLDNYAEWIWGGDPNVADHENAKVILLQVTEENGFEFSYRRMKNSEQSGIDYRIYTSTDLTTDNWTPTAPDELGSESVPGKANYETVHARIPATITGTNKILFIQVRAESSD